MAQPEIWDLTYRTNQEGLFIPFEYISNFVAGEALKIERTIINVPFDVITSVMFSIKPTKSSNVTLVQKIVTATLTSDGSITDITGEGSQYTLLLEFRPDETAQLNQKRYFIAEVVTAGGVYPIMASQGYMLGEDSHIAATPGAGIESIQILNLPGSTSIGTLQIEAQALDGIGNVVPGVEILFFTSNNHLALVDDSGLMRAYANGTVIITAATRQGNISTRATLVIS